MWGRIDVREQVGDMRTRLPPLRVVIEKKRWGCPVPTPEEG